MMMMAMSLKQKARSLIKQDNIKLSAGSLAAVNYTIKFLAMTAKMNSELSVCCVPVIYVHVVKF